MVVNLAENFKIHEFKQISTNDDLERVFPKFLWVVRDFTLRLTNNNHEEITSNQYLDNALKDVKGISDGINQKNRIRKIIKDFFRDRDCICLVRPSEEENILQDLMRTEDALLKSDFLDGVQTMRNLINSKMTPKYVNNVAVTGSMFLSVCQSYIDSINSGGVPTLQTAWNYMCINHCNKLIDQYVTDFRE